MIIRFWGARGSIPVSGQQYLKYGGDTTCVEIRTAADDIVIIDAGSGIRRLGKRLLEEKRLSFSILFTHSHLDHLLGFPFFKPIYLDETHIDMYGCPFEQESIHHMVAMPMSPPYFPVKYEDIQATIEYHGIRGQPFAINALEVAPILLSHPNRGMGFRFTEGGKSFVFLTDNELTFQHEGGLLYDDYAQFCAGADLLVHDAEFTQSEYERTRTWGHSVYNDALRLGVQAGVKQFGLFHHNQDRSDEGLDAIVEDCRRIVAGQNARVECFGIEADMVIEL